jgi:hypothetical protein
MIFNRKIGFPYKYIKKEDLCEKYLDDEQQFWDYGTQPITSPTDIIDTTKTGFSSMDEYLTKSGAAYLLKNENRKGEIVMMSPDEYFRECSLHAWKNSNNTPTSLKASRRVDTDSLEHIKTVLTKYKKKLCMPYIDYASPGQEGLHRMMVIGDMFGWDFKVPVLVVTIADEAEEVRRIKLRRDWNIKQSVEKACTKAFYYSYSDLDEFRDQLQWELDKVFDNDDVVKTPVKFEVTLAGEILTIVVNGVVCEYHESVLSFEEKDETDEDDFEISDEDLENIDIDGLLK